MKTRGIIYFNKGSSHIVRLAASMDSLRQFWRGDVCVVNIGNEAAELEKLCEEYESKLICLDDCGLAALVDKVRSLQHSPYDETVFLDADTIVTAPIDALFEMLNSHDFVFTHFAGWQANGSIIKKRIERLKKTRIIEESQIIDSLKHPAINVGTFAYRDCRFLERWLTLTEIAARNRVFIPDEIVAQVHLPRLNHHIAPPEWGVSVKFETGIENAKIIHYHGDKHDAKYPLCDKWRFHRDRSLKRVDLTRLQRPLATLVVAVDQGYLETLRRNYPTWTFVPERPMIVIHDSELPSDELSFLGNHPTLIPWKMPGVTQREKMLTSFVKLAPEIVETDYWIKLDVDCRANPESKLFTSKNWYSYDLVSHRWGYTKPGSWLCELEDWGDTVFDTKRLLTPDEYNEAKQAKRFRHPRIQSFACLHRTEFSQEASSLCGERLPVPSHDTYVWYVAKRTGRRIRRVNIKSWGYSHGKKN